MDLSLYFSLHYDCYYYKYCTVMIIVVIIYYSPKLLDNKTKKRLRLIGLVEWSCIMEVKIIKIRVDTIV